MARQEARWMITPAPGSVRPVTFEAVRAHVAATAGRRHRARVGGVALDEALAVRRRRPSRDLRAGAAPVPGRRELRREARPSNVAGEAALPGVAVIALLGCAPCRRAVGGKEGRVRVRPGGLEASRDGTRARIESERL